MPTDKLRYGTTDLLFLAIIAKNPAYGYGLWQKLNTLPDLTFSQALLYSTLHRLSSAGYLKSEHRERRIYYSVTPKGHAYLKSEVSRWESLSSLVDAIILALKQGALSE